MGNDLTKMVVDNQVNKVVGNNSDGDQPASEGFVDMVKDQADLTAAALSQQYSEYKTEQRRDKNRKLADDMRKKYARKRAEGSSGSSSNMNAAEDRHRSEERSRQVQQQMKKKYNKS
ncbi:hypothetical protein QOT17_003048 [Balamuthia mandrillaris]